MLLSPAFLFQVVLTKFWPQGISSRYMIAWNHHRIICIWGQSEATSWPMIGASLLVCQMHITFINPESAFGPLILKILKYMFWLNFFPPFPHFIKGYTRVYITSLLSVNTLHGLLGSDFCLQSSKVTSKSFGLPKGNIHLLAWPIKRLHNLNAHRALSRWWSAPLHSPLKQTLV